MIEAKSPQHESFNAPQPLACGAFVLAEIHSMVLRATYPSSAHRRRWCRVLLLCGLLLPVAAQMPSDTPARRSFAALFAPDYAFPYFQHAAGSPAVADVPAASWSLERAALFAQLSLLVYLPEVDDVRARLAPLNLVRSRFIERAGSQVWVFEFEEDVAVVFRGTEPGVTEDALTDLNLLPVAIEDGIAAHRGFVGALAAITADLDAAVAESPRKSLWLAGHSLGGALAQLYGWHQRERVAAVYTFGAPRTFTSGSTAAVEDALPVFRVENGNDLVTHLPTPPLFAHVGESWFIAHDRRLIREPSMQDELRTVWQSHQQFFDQMLERWRSSQQIQLVPGPGLADHAPAAYADALIGHLLPTSPRERELEASR